MSFFFLYIVNLSFIICICIFLSYKLFIISFIWNANISTSWPIQFYWFHYYQIDLGTFFFPSEFWFPFIGLAVGSVNFRVFIPIYIYTFWKSLLHVLMNFIIFLLIWSDVIERRFESDFFIPKLFFLPLLIMRDMWKACQCFVLPTLKLCI